MRRTLRFLLFALLALVVTTLVALVLIAKLLLAPAAGEWTVPWRIGPVTLDVGVPTAIRLLTSPWLAPRLAGFDADTRFGAPAVLQHISSLGSGGPPPERAQDGVRIGCEWLALHGSAERVLQRWIDRVQQRQRLLAQR